MKQSKEALDDWFMRAVLVHEGALMRYLHRNWRDNPSDVVDLCQEVLTRVYAAAQKERPVQVKSFIFSTARHLLCDLVRRAQIVRIELVMDMETLDISSEEADAEEQLSARQELRHLQAALEALPVKSRQVIELRRIHGYSQKEAAAHLGISESAVESHIQRGVRQLCQTLKHISEIAAIKFSTQQARRADRNNGRNKDT